MSTPKTMLSGKSKLRQVLRFAVLPSTFVIGILYLYSNIKTRPQLSARSSSATDGENVGRTSQAHMLAAGSAIVNCGSIFRARDTCAFVKENCQGFDNDGLIPYLRLFYCVPLPVRPYVLLLRFVWLLVLFASMALAAGEFLSIHLAEIVTIFDISEDLAGVTIFAFGNGSSDLFSTLAAMRFGNGSLAISELFGAAAFITTVVLGLVIVVHPFSASPTSFVGDAVSFIIAAASLTAFLADGQLILGECLGILGLYAAFIAYSLLQTRNHSDATSFTIIAQAEGAPNETSRLLATEEPRVSGDENNLYRSAESESVTTEACTVQLSSAVPAHAKNFRASVMRMFPSAQTWNGQSVGERVLTLFSLPLMIPIGLTTLSHHPSMVEKHPAENNAEHNISRASLLDALARKLPILPPLFLGPQLVVLVLTTQLNIPLLRLSFLCPAALLLSIVHLSLNLSPRLFTAGLITNAIVGFVVSLFWIYLTATSAVSLLGTLGFVLDIPTAILGGIVFAIGNSSNDLVANTAVARRGMPRLAASACFGGPMMNMLLGIGIGGLLQVLQGGNTGEHGRSVYVFEVYPGIFISAATLIVGLMATLAYSVSRGWRLDRPLGVGLMSVWVTGSVINVVVSTSESRVSKTG